MEAETVVDRGKIREEDGIDVEIGGSQTGEEFACLDPRIGLRGLHRNQ